MKINTGIKDINGDYIYVGDKVKKKNRLDKDVIWTVKFERIKCVIHSTIKTIVAVVLVDENGYTDIMEYEMFWQYTENDITKYEIIKDEEND